VLAVGSIPTLKASNLFFKWALVKTKGDKNNGNGIIDLVVKVDPLKAFVRVCVVSMTVMPFPAAILLNSAQSNKVSIPQFPILGVRIVNGDTFKSNEDAGEALRWPLSIDYKRASYQRKDGKTPILHLLYLPVHEDFYLNSRPRDSSLDIVINDLLSNTAQKTRSIELAWRIDIDWQLLQDYVDRKQVGKPTEDSPGYPDSAMPDYLPRHLMRWPPLSLRSSTDAIIDHLLSKVDFNVPDTSGVSSEKNSDFKTLDPVEDDLDDRFSLVHAQQYPIWQGQFGVKRGRVMNSKLDGISELADRVLEFLYRELWVDDACTGRDKLHIPRIWLEAQQAGGGLARQDTPQMFHVEAEEMPEENELDGEENNNEGDEGMGGDEDMGGEQ
jgi:hypothetical protein